MSFVLSLILLAIFAGCIGFLFPEGMWGNAVRLVNVILAALVATNFFEPLAGKLDAWQPSYSYCWDFLALWGLFGVTVVVLRTVTDRISRVKVRFLKIIDQIGSAFFAALIGWVLVGFTLITLHTAPLGKTFFFGAFQSSEAMFFGMAAPDREWLGFMEHMSRGPLCHSATAEQSQAEAFVFCPRTTNFIANYDIRRQAVEDHVKLTGTIRLGEVEKPVAPAAPPPPAVPPQPNYN